MGTNQQMFPRGHNPGNLVILESKVKQKDTIDGRPYIDLSSLVASDN